MKKVDVTSMDDLCGLAMEASDLILAALPEGLLDADAEFLFEAIADALQEIYPEATFEGS